MRFLFALCLLVPLALSAQERLEVDYELLEYMQLKSNDDTASLAKGTVGNGSLEHGKLMPYKGCLLYTSPSPRDA